MNVWALYEFRNMRNITGNISVIPPDRRIFAESWFIACDKTEEDPELHSTKNYLFLYQEW